MLLSTASLPIPAPQPSKQEAGSCFFFFLFSLFFFFSLSIFFFFIHKSRAGAFESRYSRTAWRRRALEPLPGMRCALCRGCRVTSHAFLATINLHGFGDSINKTPAKQAESSPTAASQAGGGSPLNVGDFSRFPSGDEKKKGKIDPRTSQLTIKIM